MEELPTVKREGNRVMKVAEELILEMGIREP